MVVLMTMVMMMMMGTRKSSELRNIKGLRWFSLEERIALETVFKQFSCRDGAGFFCVLIDRAWRSSI